MLAGSGIRHSEYNYEDGATELFQIWIQPASWGLAPRWETRRFPEAARDGRLVALASGRSGVEGALLIHQEATLFGATLAPGQSVHYELARSRRAYLVPARGGIQVNGTPVGARSGVAIAEEVALDLRASEEGEILLVDLP